MVKNKKTPQVTTVSAIVLVGGSVDQQLLNNCLKSLSWCNEVIKIDTTKILGSFSEWRNEGIKKAKGDWLLYVDIDEEITNNLQKEIQLTITNSQLTNTAYAIPRKNIIFGQEFKHGGQWPDYQIRLFKRSSLKKWVGNLHERPIFAGNMNYIKNSIIHHKNITVSQMIEKTNKWSEIESRLLYKSKHPKMNIFRFISVAFREFQLRFLRQLCFLDGSKGVIYGIYQIYSKLITYSKLWEKQLSIIHI
ncbi:hypothetical protein A2130_02345 [Candidatus Woesebacteria bacterium GWC2_33_12]|uniref:Glycosyl transferase n=1 Tax=Candidatus Woesebacteria bacterium GW2011_GWB1_33_22 TaxID=1618566 RepID=A0A0F9ZMN3_9BACT|nr:MAG: Glycosyl transferase [Candidatus Woesebacteria bacterium GW2011_GWC2_33_12]KKP42797.1 MAG: Glycosyl transferase [Candidatus Woesebacteria bacterium GW2011_GWA2_33_20]KKP45429.1 MAG: Glycosyl transferase [Candidatus Woesebacteria bacterium GW2011_GWB1_33_22]KKP46270.1 MAG: hypothetical protein UR37_C0010G0026 [Microgenomates group bacterium GW2011_GWC1_33_28]KKP50379.1 MAG: Glycosyl transferase [Candidatus Woesebacteria bacterium GW2011_GWA1_33_33]OGM07863.1 MAG: hypothetical protein A2